MRFLSTVIAFLFAANAGAQNIERINPEGMTHADRLQSPG